MAAAASAILAVCRAGSHIICLRDVYQPVKRFLNNICVPRLSMSVTYLTGLDLSALEAAVRPETDLIILESPATFVFTVVDIEKITAIARRRGIKTYIDNTYCTPLFQKPLDLGVDIVMHTLSKYIGGHSDIVGGVLASKDDALMRKIISETREWVGGILGPMEAWLAIRGLRTLEARLYRHQETALRVAEFLQGRREVKRVLYTGLPSHPQRETILRQQTGHTGLMSFELDVPPQAAVAFIDRLRLFGKGCSWGGFESLALTPLYHATEEELEFLGLRGSRGLIRIHCGLEGADNLIADLENSLNFK
jgi:cystathionine gamma-lyase